MNPIQWLVEMPLPINLSCSGAAVYSMADYDALRDSEIDKYLDGEVLDAVRSGSQTVCAVYGCVDVLALVGTSQAERMKEVSASLHRLRRAGKVVRVNGKWVAA